MSSGEKAHSLSSSDLGSESTENSSRRELRRALAALPLVEGSDGTESSFVKNLSRVGCTFPEAMASLTEAHADQAASCRSVVHLPASRASRDLLHVPPPPPDKIVVASNSN